MNTNRIRDRLIVIIGDSVSPFGDAARWELYDAALGILSEYVLIPRADLPPVERLDTDASTGEYDVRVGNEQHRGAVAVDSDYDYRAAALVHLAIAEYRKANPPMPPVDEADVDALTQVLLDTRTEADPRLTAEEQYTIVARRLLQTGQVQVNRDDG